VRGFKPSPFGGGSRGRMISLRKLFILPLPPSKGGNIKKNGRFT